MASRSPSSLVAERMRIPSYSPIRCSSSARSQPTPDVDLEVLAQQVDPGVADLLGDEHARHDRSRTQSMQAVSACTSAGSVAGNMATRSWLRPSLR